MLRQEDAQQHNRRKPGFRSNDDKPLKKKRAPVRIRTSNLLIRSQMLYPVELRALKGW